LSTDQPDLEETVDSWRNTYACETWSLTKGGNNRLAIFERRKNVDRYGLYDKSNILALR